ncbi:ATP-dependent RNA helicase HrpA [Mycolicibacter hiberniae]|uniref:ATP-dependent helicase HrpA n=1 Tax=Mycolicibacter hiberniae TaxID=29314 RepID=A0A7I7X3U6_9MYCO|nr:ATP-dependent RNA helicase HrpA [Mycolicibacter hiberniae]MCV7086333.1 ATP-dependent RNA helicase HrpA [Mycolicibacter hiberniae]ORV69576.1 ATP-dependent RNA helicase HrpA [Mycolicibacter hiberniae]BBZ24509.1 ATP-dependent helicase HrpA [Mycolicibacter hiberniae]
MSEPSVAQLRTQLDGLTIRDAAYFGRRLKDLRGEQPEKLRQLAERMSAAQALIAQRRAAVPAIGYPDLPVSARRDEIAAAISAHQVVVVAGETGSGKTTQLPKICLELGRGIRGTIGHTQPRRLAARTVAARIAEELATPLGDVVGYAVRFTDRVSDRTLIKLMTDGILLAELERDRRLLRYDTLIIDEAHERSLNIDFLLGYLRELLPRRPDLKVIITSATIEPQRFAAHFAGPDGASAPIVEVSGRSYPVEIRYRPLELPVVGDTDNDPDDPDHEIIRSQTRDEIEAIVDAVHELSAEQPGDILVFLSGEREIRDTAEALGGLPNTEILPLYARLSTAEQQKVFAPARTGRRIVLATNVAETSLTVPGIRYVIDPGNARISRYSRRLKVQRLPIEPISQASAAQRSGRCGRTAPGVCIRLYSEADFEARPRYTDPEVLRTNLAAVLLRMASLRLGAVEDFGFLDPPDARSIRDGVQLLVELGAFTADGQITDIGRRLARLPVDPRLGRMIVAAETEGCVREVLVLAAALTIPDPRERPIDREEAARQKHARFADDDSDFIAYLNLWSYLSEQRKTLSGSAFRRMCRNEFLHYLRIREWQDLVGQLRSIAGDVGIRDTADKPAAPAAIHAALLAGLLSHVGMRRSDGREYAGARNSKFVLAPGSVLAKRPPRWTMVAELVETSRLFGRTAARIQPEAVERVAADLVQRSYSEPHWDAKRGEVMAFEKVTLYGLPLVTRRRVGYARVEPVVAREMFIRHALVEGEWTARHRFLADNAALRTQLQELEDRVRRRDLIVDDDTVYDLYDARIPAEVVSARHFDSWWKRQRQDTPELLTFTRDELLRTDETLGADRPDRWATADLALPLSYRFEPGAADDGVTVHVPIDVLARLHGDEFAWQVPALREELVTALIRSLPKELRRNFVPAPDTARAVLSVIGTSTEPLLEALAGELRRRTGVLVPVDAFDMTTLPAHLRVTFAVEAADGTELARGKDLAALQERLSASAREAIADAVGAELERTGLRGWPDDLDTLPQTVQRVVAGRAVRGFPAFADAGGDAELRVFATEAQQRGALGPGIRRLLRCEIPSPVKAVERQLDSQTRLMLKANPDGSLQALIDDCADAAADALVPAPVWTRDEFVALRKRVAAALVATTADVVTRVAQVLAAARETQVALPVQPPAAQAESIADITGQLEALLAPGFVTATGRAHLGDLTRYLAAIRRRLEQLPRALQADRDRMARVQGVQQAYQDLLAVLPAARRQDAAVREIARQIEELRVSLWAQQLGTPRPVSEQRIYRAIDALLA